LEDWSLNLKSEMICILKPAARVRPRFAIPVNVQRSTCNFQIRKGAPRLVDQGRFGTALSALER